LVLECLQQWEQGGESLEALASQHGNKQLLGADIQQRQQQQQQ
jgi:hypothetical protein